MGKEHMRKFLHGTGIVLLAMLGSAVLVFLLSTITNMLTVFDRPPSAFLPANSTLAVFHNPTQENLALFAPWFPELNEVKKSSGTTTIALIALPNAVRAPLVFSRTQNIPREESIDLGAYSVASPSKEALTFIATSTGEILSDDSAYRELRDGKDRSDSWAFMKKEALPIAPTLPERVLVSLLIGGAEAVAFSRERDTLTITCYGEENTLTENVEAPPATQTGDVLLFNLIDARHIWENLSADLEQDTQIILEGLLQQLLRKGFGDVVSMEYDILPLLEKNLSVHLLYNSSGTLLIGIRGEIENSEQLFTVTEHLHEGARLNLPTTKITDYVFDNRFSTRNIRSDRSTFKEELFMQDNWQIRSTRAVGNITGLFTATNNEEFIIANTEEALLSSLQDQKTETLNSFTEKEIHVSVRQGKGWIEKDAFLSLLEKNIPALIDTVDLPMLTNLPSRIIWSMERRGPRTTITLRSS